MPYRSRVHKLSLFRSPKIFSATPAFQPSSFSTPVSLSPNPPPTSTHPQHLIQSEMCVYVQHHLDIAMPHQILERLLIVLPTNTVIINKLEEFPYTLVFATHITLLFITNIASSQPNGFLCNTSSCTAIGNAGYRIPRTALSFNDSPIFYHKQKIIISYLLLMVTDSNDCS